MDLSDLNALSGELARKQREIGNAISAARALDWLNQYGDDIHDRESATARIHLNLASCCSGSKEASELLDAAAQALMPEIVERAIGLAEAAITLARGDAS